MTKKSTAKKPDAQKAAPEKEKVAPLAGHNSGSVNQPLVKIFEEYELLESNKRELSKAQAALKAKAKEEHAIQKTNFSDEIRMRKLDSAVRQQFEQSREDLKRQLGYQYAMALATASQGTAAKPGGAITSATNNDAQEGSAKPASGMFRAPNAPGTLPTIRPVQPANNDEAENEEEE